MELTTIRGQELRYLLTVTLLDCGRELTLRELLEAVDASGFVVAGRASKTVSDALRWEVRKGRIVRTGRARYGPGRMPRSTQWWIRQRVQRTVDRLSLQRRQSEVA